MYLSFCHFHFLWTELQLNSVRRQTDCRVFGFWALGRGTWDWDLGSELDLAKSSQVDGEACGQHHRVGFSSAFFFLHVFFIFCTSLGEACRRGCEAKTWQLQNQPTNENF